MPFRLDEFRAKMQFITSARMPHLVYRAAIKTGKPSNTVYIQHVLCEALARDLGLDLDELLDELPPPQGPTKSQVHAIHRRRLTGPAGAVQEVR